MQGVGLYNNLLSGENSSENNNEEDETEKFNESNLYSVNSLGYYEIVERASDVENGTAEKVTVKNNRVYCCGKPTIYDYYGKIVVAPYTFSTTSEFANLVFILKGPFYADYTRVTITYGNDVEVERYPDALKYSNNFALISEGAEMEAIPSGHVIEVSSRDHYIPIRLRIKRANFVGSDVLESLITSVTLNNGFEDVTPTIHFCETVLFYKDGVGYNGFDPDNPTFTYLTVDNNGKANPSTSHLPQNNPKYIEFTAGNRRLMWIYNPNDPFRSIPENKVIIDYSKNVRFYCRITYFSGGSSDLLRFLNLADEPLEFYDPVGGGVSMFQTILNSSDIKKYLRQWPSVDGFVASQFYSFAHCLTKNVTCEKPIAIGGAATIRIAEIGIMKYNNFLNDWGL